jgi:hypothetical protein
MPEDPEITTDDDGGDDESVVEALRDMPVGTNDPNIVGDAGPLDVPPGTDPPQEGELEE